MLKVAEIPLAPFIKGARGDLALRKKPYSEYVTEWILVFQGC